MRLIISHIVLLSLLGFNCYAQENPVDSVYDLKEVIISSDRLNKFATGTKIQAIDTAVLNLNKRENLADLLSEETPLFIKSYGLGSLATSSFRGGSAYHTAVLWNGFNLNNPANGQLDLALMPNIFSGKVNIQYGGSTALWGSGAVGGAIILENNLGFDRGETIEIGAKIGSFETYTEDFHIEISKPKWVSSLKLFRVDAKNDFEFKDPTQFGNPKRNQTHAELKETGLMSESAFKLNKEQQLNFRFWYQTSDRNIPPILFQNIGTSTQKDESYRLTSEWQINKGHLSYSVRAAYFDEYLDYTDQNIIEAGKSSAQSFILEAESKLQLQKGILINVGINNTYANAQADHYDANSNQNRTALFVSISKETENRKFRSSISFRQELVDQKLVPFAFSIGSSYQLKKWILLKGAISRVYRLPTFNELYWVPGGNKDLLAETGFTEDLSIVVKPQAANQRAIYSIDLTAFNRVIDNWILWLPGSGYWSPQNLLKVWSRGLEASTSISYNIQKLKLKANVLANYTASTNEIVRNENDASLHKQLIYVPKYSGHGRLTAEYKNLIISYVHNYTGFRYTSTDNTDEIPAYWIANLATQIQFVSGSYSIVLSGKINNLYNNDYQVLLNRPMPLSNYQLGIQISYHHKK